MFVSIEQLGRQIAGIDTIVDRCAQEKWIRPVEKRGVGFLSTADIYKLRFIFYLRETGTPWEDIPKHLKPRKSLFGRGHRRPVASALRYRPT